MEYPLPYPTILSPILTKRGIFSQLYLLPCPNEWGKGPYLDLLLWPAAQNRSQAPRLQISGYNSVPDFESLVWEWYYSSIRICVYFLRLEGVKIISGLLHLFGNLVSSKGQDQKFGPKYENRGIKSCSFSVCATMTENIKPNLLSYFLTCPWAPSRVGTYAGASVASSKLPIAYKLHMNAGGACWWTKFNDLRNNA